MIGLLGGAAHAPVATIDAAIAQSTLLGSNAPTAPKRPHPVDTVSMCVAASG
jgi:hypothetical protein